MIVEVVTEPERERRADLHVMKFGVDVMGLLHVISSSEDSYERGYALGEQVNDLVRTNVEIYMKRFHHYGLSRQSVPTLARKFGPLVKYDEEMFREMQAVAESTDAKLEEIIALNVRYELLSGSWAGS